jgi:HPt (histidine-containing phosphotransfer) domain-containing protein
MHEILSTLEFLKELKERLEDHFDDTDVAFWLDEIDEHIQDLQKLLENHAL